MTNISERADDLRYIENMEKFLADNPDKSVALERVIKIEMSYIVGNTKNADDRHITITMPVDISLSDNLVNLLEKLKQGESAVIDDVSTIRFETGFCAVE